MHPIFPYNTFLPARKQHHFTSDLSSDALPSLFARVMLAATFFDQLDQTKQSPRNAKSAATQLWGNLKPVGIVGKVFSLRENPRSMKVAGKLKNAHNIGKTLFSVRV